MITGKLPRAQLTYLPTPLEEAPRLSAALGGPRLWIKRDDRTGLTFGGNKPRIFDYVFGDVLAQGCDMVITPAGPQSNHLREVTAAANRLGLKSVIVIFGADGSEELQGNRLLFDLLGAEIRYFSTNHHDAYYDPALLEFTEKIRAEFEAKGHKPYVVHFATRSGVLGTVAHVEAAEELAKQFEAMNRVPDFLYVPTGSGVTTSGFVLGFKHLGIPIRVVGCSVIWPPAQTAGDTVRYANAGAEELGLSTRVTAGDFTMLDATEGGYEVITPPVSEAIRLLAKNEGILLDPTYNGKAMATLIAQIRNGALTAGHTAVLLHTGGVPALFGKNKELAS
ncbi:MAG: pyridoxal-phosphate dependent enzyme [SAR324 cluster bacterium]|nr:pyridoxal-phosphate dependent enzyme [SAR324 cluster bacterium]